MGVLAPSFSSDHELYEASVNASSVELIAVTQDPASILLIKENDEPYGIILSGERVVVELNVGENVIRYQVVAENGYDFQDYTLIITR